MASRHDRRAFSLLEIVLSLAILAGAVAVLTEITTSGLRQARLARDLAHAQLLCESKLAEIASGLVPPQTQAETHFEDDSDWLYAIDISSAGESDLLALRVTVKHQNATQSYPVEFTLVQWMVDPDFLISAAEAAASQSSTSESSDSTTNTSGTGAGS